MIHQLQIHPVIAGDVLDAVGKFLSGCEQLLEIAEAAGHRFAARVDDFGIGQNQVDESDMPEIVRHLVDEEGLRSAIDAGVRKVFFAMLRALLRAETLEGGGIGGGRFIGVSTLDGMHQARYLRKFPGTLHPRMGREDLLEQSRSGARQPHDEYRVRTRAAMVLARCEELPRTDGHLPPRITLEWFGRIASLALLERVAALVVAKG